MELYGICMESHTQDIHVFHFDYQKVSKASDLVNEFLILCNS